MLPPLLTAVVVLAYASLVVELTVFPIPSEASTLQLMRPLEPERERCDDVARARESSVAARVLRFVLPTALGIAAFLLPLGVLAWSPLYGYLFPVDALRTPGVAWVGCALIVAGRSLTFTSVLQLRARRAAAGVQHGGLFRWSRNPGLLGMYLFYAGLCLAFPCWILFAAFAPYVLNMHQRVLLEESRLAQLGGDAFREYSAEVPRYFGIGASR